MLSAEGLTAEAARRALRGTLVHEAATGRLRSSRGHAVREERLVELALALAQLATRFAGFAPAGGLGLSELEVNPMVVAEDGRVVALDGLARLHRPKPLLPSRPVAELRRLLVPQSALVVGASAEGMNPGRIILRNLVAGRGRARASGSGPSTRRPARSTAAARSRRSPTCPSPRTSRSSRSRPTAARTRSSRRSSRSAARAR